MESLPLWPLIPVLAFVGAIYLMAVLDDRRMGKRIRDLDRRVTPAE